MLANQNKNLVTREHETIKLPSNNNLNPARLGCLKNNRSKQHFYKSRAKPKIIVNNESSNSFKSMVEYKDPKSYISCFNGFTHYVKNYDYHTKNDSIFTWNVHPQQYKRVLLPEFKPVPSPDKTILAYETANAEIDLLQKLYEFYNPTNRKNLYAPLPYKLDLLAKSQSAGNLGVSDQKEITKSGVKMPVLKKKIKGLPNVVNDNDNTEKEKELTSPSENKIENMTMSILKSINNDYSQLFPKNRAISVSRIQRKHKANYDQDLKSGKESINNEEHFLNNSDKKNLMINKVISHINIDERLINKDHIKEIAMTKIGKLLGEPKRLSEIIIIKPKTTEIRSSKIDERDIGNKLDLSEKKGLNSTESNNPKICLSSSKIIPRGIMHLIPAESVKSNFHLPTTQVFTFENESRSHMVTSSTTRRAKTVNARKKGQLGIGISKNDLIESKNKAKELDEMLTKFQDNLNSKKVNEMFSDEKSVIEGVQTERPLTRSSGAKSLAEDFINNRPNTTNNQNFFNFNSYFKTKYVEKGMKFDISNQLKKRCDDMEKQIKDSLKRLEEIEKNTIDEGKTV